MTSVLVTGANGLIGSRVCETAERAGHTVTRLMRHGAAADDVLLRDLTRPLDDVPPHDWVFHLAGGYAGASRRALKRTDLRITKNLLRWGARHGVKNWVFASAAEVYGEVDGLGSEHSPARPVIPYGDIKLRTEALFARFAAQNPDARVVILRIGEVYGSKARLVRELTARLTRGLCPWPGSGRVPVSFVHVDDVAQAFVRATASEAGGISVFNVADAEPATWRDFLEAFAEKLGTPPPVFLPRPLVQAYAFGHTFAHRLVGREPVLTRYALRLLTTPKALSIEKISRELGFAPRYPNIRIGLEDVLHGLSHHAQDGAAQGTAARASA